MALQEKEKLIAFNLKTLQKRDAAIDAILDMSSHVVLCLLYTSPSPRD